MSEKKKASEKGSKKAADESATAAKSPSVASKEDVSRDDFTHLVRLSGVVVDGGLTTSKALMKIKGIGYRLSESILESAKIDKKTKVGELKEDQISELEKKIESIDSLVPSWMLNRKKDIATGKDIHKIGPELDMQLREDINLQKKIRSYRGVRHQLNLPVRGQRTRSTGRTGSTMGVSRKKAATTKAKPAQSKK
jgi:small subunit ribosomal protein S13